MILYMDGLIKCDSSLKLTLDGNITNTGLINGLKNNIYNLFDSVKLFLKISDYGLTNGLKQLFNLNKFVLYDNMNITNKGLKLM